MAKGIVSVIALLFPLFAAASPGEAIRSMPVQDGGRIKPYDTFANETLEVVYGKKKYEGKPAWQVVFTWLLAPTAWTGKELFEVRHHEILKALKLDPAKRWFKGEELFGSERFSELMQELRVKRESKEKLTPVFQAMQRLENQYFVFREMAEGRLLRVMPPPRDASAQDAAHLIEDGETWLSVADLPEGPVREAFMAVSKAFVDYLGDADKGGALDAAVAAYDKVVREARPDLVPAAKNIAVELHFNDFHPFRWAYIMYALAAVALLLSWILDKNALMKPAWALMILGFLLNTYGFGLRIYLTGRPPVSNMYETVVWVAWGSVLFASILEFLSRTKFILLAGAIAGTVALVIADSAPAVLDPSLQPLEAVLRSNYWLLIHVMTITISYAAFLLAFILGDLGLIHYLRDPRGKDPKAKELVLAIYRCMQIGVAFLAPGIILGGVWADYSWGRFWGWDPKETWALIALLGYLAVLHGRMTNWIRDFGMVVMGVATFSLVVMAWYGVNFVLGAGLHSYGFGAGGVEYVSGVLFLHALFVLYVWMLRRARIRAA